MSTIDLTNASAEELQKALAVKQKEERQRKLEAKASYEKQRDENIMEMINDALVVSSQTEKFKKLMHSTFDYQKELLDKYSGGLRKNSKGGFSLVHSSGNYKIVRSLKSQPKWDERADEAVALINEFLEAKLKRTKHYQIIHTLLEKNKAGELSYPMVMRLIEIKDSYEDPRWVRAMELLIESFERVYSGYGYEFYTKSKDGSFEKIEINFTAL